MVAEAVVILHGQVEARQQVALFIQRRIDVQCAAVAIPTAGAGLQAGEAFGLGLLGDDIHRTAGVAAAAAAIEAGGGTLEQFDAFDIGRVRPARVTAVGAEAVLVKLGRSEAAHAVFVEGQAAEIVLPGHAAGKVQGAFDAVAAEVVQYGAGNYADGLGDFTERGVGPGCAGRAGGAVTLYRAIGQFRAGADDAVAQLRGGDRGGGMRGGAEQAEQADEQGEGRAQAKISLDYLCNNITLTIKRVAVYR